MPQNPNSNDIYLKYYVKDKKLVLKNVNDFPEEFETGQNYNDFKNKVLNKIGNLEIEFTDKNSRKSNKGSNNFNTYKHIEKNDDIVKKIRLLFDRTKTNKNQ